MKTKFWRGLFSDQRITGNYVHAGGQFGDAVSMIYMGECTGFEKLLTEFEDWEQEYARRGYRALSVDAFVGYGGWGKPIGQLLNIKREVNEEPIFHAKLYREHFLGRIKPTIDIEQLIQGGQPQVGHYVVPSTELIVDLERKKK